jgi:hypothetical protein
MTAIAHEVLSAASTSGSVFTRLPAGSPSSLSCSHTCILVVPRVSPTASSTVA